MSSIDFDYCLNTTTNLYDFTKCAHKTFNLMYADNEPYKQEFFGTEYDKMITRKGYEGRYIDDFLGSYSYLEQKYSTIFCTCSKTFKEIEKDHNNFHPKNSTCCKSCGLSTAVNHMVYHFHKKELLIKAITGELYCDDCPSICLSEEIEREIWKIENFSSNSDLESDE